MSPSGHYRAALAHAFRAARHRARALAERDGSLPAGLVNGKPPSLAEQHEYAKARHWVPAGHDGGLLEGMGVVYHAVVGRPGVAAFNAAAAIVSRPLRFVIAAGLALVTACAALAAAGEAGAAVLAGGCAALLVAAWTATGWLVTNIPNPPAWRPRHHETEES